MTPITATFDEDAWLAAQAARGARLRDNVTAWLAAQNLGEPLGAQVRLRVVLEDMPGRPDSPGTFAMAMAEALGAPPDKIDAVGLAAHLYWAAADVADDIDDGEPGAPPANVACALLFLAQRALAGVSARAVEEGASYGLRMAGGQALDLAATDCVATPDIDRIVADKAGAELAFFMFLACEATGKHDAALLRLAHTFGVALQLFSDVIDLYVKPVSDDFAAGKWTWPLASYRASVPQAAGVLFALDRRDPAVLARLRWEAGKHAAAALNGLDADLLSAWGLAVPALRDPAPLAAAVAWAVLAIRTLHEGLAELPEAPMPPLVSAEQACVRAAAFLEQSRFQEEQRWGLFGAPWVEGGVFTAVFQAAALRAAGGEWRPAYERLLAMRDADGWRYYPGRREIPPDADDAGLILGYFHDVLPPSLVQATAAQLQGGFDGDMIHTWLLPAEGDVAWTGDDCLATLSNACWGLLRAGYAAAVPAAALDRLEAALHANALVSAFYEPHAVRFFAHRALALAAHTGLLEAARGAALQSLLREQLRAEERLAGNYGDRFVVNASNLLAAQAWGIEGRPELRLWLAVRQTENGAWPAEPVFMTPGVNMRPRRWGHEGLTTSWVLLALAGEHR